MDPKFSEAELALLTEEERQGLLDEELQDDGAGDEDGDDDAAGGDTAGGDDGADASHTDEDGDDDDDSGAADDAAAKAATDAAAAAAAAAAAKETPAATESEAQEPEERAPRWIVPGDLDEKLQAIDSKREEIAKRFDEGELTAEELRAQLKPLDTEYRTIERQQIKAEVARETALETWHDDVSSFIGQHQQYKSPVLASMLDAEVRKLQVEAVNPLNPKLLEKAHANIAEQVKAAFGIETPNPKPAPDPGKKTGGKAADAAAKPAAKARPDLPPNLGNVPAADITDADDGGEFAHLDRLAAKDSVSFERELAKMSPDARDRYLAQ
ncbi:hypothetical protein J2T08_003616 [Neorhizobium galegae]|uniref:hypothetical protein n=1 Tax=Neorhizobium galegae TaxID=399 RepID=UPI002783A601|nr:hypothetical protein [Neorhizobium galegae]MDQ0135695.1 hypothetical protein [Neorhizobium galegae]